MRTTLNAVYEAAAWIAAAMMVGVLGMVLLGIFGRQLDFYLPGTDAYAGYLMAGSGFMALAHTFKRNEHIRVTLMLQALGATGRRRLDIWGLLVATFLAGVMAFYSIRLAWQSHLFNDISTSNDATALWIPQISMALGTAVLVLALFDDLVLEVLNRRKPPDPGSKPVRSE